MSRLNLPASVAGASALVTLIVLSRVLVITHSHWSPLATATLPSVSAGVAGWALSTHEVEAA